jgi:predicted membrane chloride channel (bestrophin family)
LTDVLSGTERVVNTPLPIAYSISISQITWAYVLALPFQLVGYLGWVTIPGESFTALMHTPYIFGKLLTSLLCLQVPSSPVTSFLELPRLGESWRIRSVKT